MLRAILLCFAYMRSSIERCDKLSAAYLAYERDQPCPSSQDATSDDPLSALAFAPECTGLAPPPRACVAPTPAAAIEPAEMRMWEPPIENIAAARFPKYDLGGGSWRGGSKKRGHTDCTWCFDFKGSKTTDEAYVKKMAKTIPLSTPAIRTAVDMGAGSGGVLAVLQAAPYNVIGVGLTMSMDNAPHLEVMGARGLIGLRWSLAKALPFADGAFDLLHARLSGLGSAGAQAATRWAAAGRRTGPRARHRSQNCHFPPDLGCWWGVRRVDPLPWSTRVNASCDLYGSAHAPIDSR